MSVQLDNGEPLHYRAERHAAEQFATAAAYLAIITIDDHIQSWMPTMPCQNLWH